MGARAVDMTGQVFGRLTVLARADIPDPKNVRWECVCECGKIKTVLAGNLRSGCATSCGCYAIEVKHLNNRTHGKTKTPEYKTWSAIHDRCNTPTNKDYVDYGGRGIRICKEWESSFQAFLDYVGERPSPEHSLDRIDNDGNYEPGNVRWATRIEQAINRRNTHWITYKSETKHLSGWARELNISNAALCGRINRHGIERAIEMGGTSRGPRSHLSKDSL